MADQLLVLPLYLTGFFDPRQKSRSWNPGFNAADPATWQTPKDQQFLAKAANILAAHPIANPEKLPK